VLVGERAQLRSRALGDLDVVVGYDEQSLLRHAGSLAAKAVRRFARSG